MTSQDKNNYGQESAEITNFRANTKSRGRICLAACLFFAAAAAFDQWTKCMAVSHLKGQSPVTLIDGVFKLQYLENRGAAFGMMQDMQYVFVVGAVLICAAVIFLFMRMPFTRRYTALRVCAVLLCAGAVGNMIDRIRLNYVVDFFYFCLIDFPIFNVADCYVVIAVVLFAFLILFYYKDEDDLSFAGRKKG